MVMLGSGLKLLIFYYLISIILKREYSVKKRKLKIDYDFGWGIFI